MCVILCRLVNENEVKQWKEQAEKMRKGVCDYNLCFKVVTFIQFSFY